MDASHATTAGNTPHDPPGSRDRDVRLAAVHARAILLVTAGCVVFVATGWVSPVRVVFALAFILFVPGLAIAELLDIRDLAQRAVIATSASLALETLVAIGLLYAGAFSLRLAVAILAGFTLVVVGTAVIRNRRAQVQRDRVRPAA